MLTEFASAGKWLSVLAFVLGIALNGCQSFEAAIPSSPEPEGTASPRVPTRRGPAELKPPASPAPESEGFTIQLEPTVLYVERGKSATVKITVKRTRNFKGDITISVSSLPSQVTATAPFRMSRSEESASLTFSTRPTLAFPERTITVIGSGVVRKIAKTHSQTLTLRLSRVLGEFKETLPDFHLLDRKKRSPDRQFILKIVSGRQVGVPQAYAASFQTASGVARAVPIGFNLDPSSKTGGAGFCPGATVGVVLSANPISLGVPSDYTVTFLQLTQPRFVWEFEVYASNGSAYVRPRVFFSPDCTLALFTGVDHGKGGEQKALTVIDLLSGSRLGAEILYNTTFKAAVSLDDNQATVEINADGKRTRYPISKKG